MCQLAFGDCTAGGLGFAPSTEWISRQLMEAYGWEEGPCYLVRDRDSVYGEVFIRRLRAMGIRDRPTALARRLAVIMHRIWVDGTEFRWTREAAAA